MNSTHLADPSCMHSRTVFPDAQLAASARVVAALCRKFAIPVDRTHILGHNEVPGATHTDPGVMWPWERFMALVAGS